VDWFEQHLNWAAVIYYLSSLTLIGLSALAAFTYEGIKDQTAIMIIDLVITWVLGAFFLFYTTRWYLAHKKKTPQN
jgi:hypothetical protein